MLHVHVTGVGILFFLEKSRELKMYLNAQIVLQQHNKIVFRRGFLFFKFSLDISVSIFNYFCDFYRVGSHL